MSKIKFVPLEDRLLIQRENVETTYHGLIHLPDNRQDKPQIGLVISCGPGKPDYPMCCKEGDKVLFGKYSGTDIKLNDQDYTIMREADILGILIEEAEASKS